MDKNIVYIGGARGLAKSSFVEQVQKNDPRGVRQFNCTEVLMDELGVQDRRDLHEIGFEEKKVALNRGILNAVNGVSQDVRLILIDGHFAIEIKEGEFELNCFPDSIKDRIHTAYNLTAEPEDIERVRLADKKIRVTGLPSIKRELELNEQEAERIRDELRIAVISMDLDVEPGTNRWDLEPIFEEIEEIQSEIDDVWKNSDPELTGKKIEITLKQPYLNQVEAGTKTIEGRIASRLFGSLERGDVITFLNRQKRVRTVVLEVRRYRDFDKLVDNEPIGKLIPGMNSEDAKDTYFRIYGNRVQQVRRSGVVAIEIKLIK